MNRLTKNNDTQYDLIGKYDSNNEEFCKNHKLRNELLNKLGQLEDIEEELGIDFNILVEAIKYSVFVKTYDGGIDEVEPYIGYSYGECVLKFYGMESVKYLRYYPYKTKDYGKTWALTQEELER